MSHPDANTCYRDCLPGFPVQHQWQNGFCSRSNPVAVPPTSVFIAPDGTVYRLTRVDRDAVTRVVTEKYDILTLAGSQSVRYELPDGSRLAWTPLTS